MYILFVIYEYTIKQGWLHQITQAHFLSKYVLVNFDLKRIKESGEFTQWHVKGYSDCECGF